MSDREYFAPDSLLIRANRSQKTSNLLENQKSEVPTLDICQVEGHWAVGSSPADPRVGILHLRSQPILKVKKNLFIL